MPGEDRSCGGARGGPAHECLDPLPGGIRGPWKPGLRAGAEHGDDKHGWFFFLFFQLFILRTLFKPFVKTEKI